MTNTSVFTKDLFIRMPETHNFKIEELSAQQCQAVARLHIVGIKAGFISSLGIDFLTVLYEAIAESEFGFGFVARENGVTVGFIAMTTNLGKLYKSIVLKNGLKFAFVLAGKMVSIRMVKKAFETLFYPSRVKKMSLPPAELLSVVVAVEQRGRGLATALLQRALQECAHRGIQEIKVLVGADMEPANRWYVNCGFKLQGQIENHGNISNVYTVRIE